MLSKNLLKAKQLINQPSRAYQQWGKTYQTGFDRMLLDKLSFTGLGSNWFVIFGLLNGLAYGASHLMRKEDYLYHFAYDGQRSSLFNAFKSMFGSNTFANAVWTVPSLIGCGWYLGGKLGQIKTTKFFALSLFSSYIFLSAANPQSGLNIRPLRSFIYKFDSYSDEGKYTMGSDQICQAVIYMTLLYHRQWLIALPCMAFDVLYYGPSTLGGPLAALAGAFMFL
jgi:hypothetical protein